MDDEDLFFSNVPATTSPLFPKLSSSSSPAVGPPPVPNKVHQRVSSALHCEDADLIFSAKPTTTTQGGQRSGFLPSWENEDDSEEEDVVVATKDPHILDVASSPTPKRVAKPLDDIELMLTTKREREEADKKEQREKEEAERKLQALKEQQLAAKRSKQTYVDALFGDEDESADVGDLPPQKTPTTSPTPQQPAPGSFSGFFIGNTKQTVPTPTLIANIKSQEVDGEETNEFDPSYKPKPKPGAHPAASIFPRPQTTTTTTTPAPQAAVTRPPVRTTKPSFVPNFDNSDSDSEEGIPSLPPVKFDSIFSGKANSVASGLTTGVTASSFETSTKQKEPSPMDAFFASNSPPPTVLPTAQEIDQSYVADEALPNALETLEVTPLDSLPFEEVQPVVVATTEAPAAEASSVSNEESVLAHEPESMQEEEPVPPSDSNFEEVKSDEPTGVENEDTGEEITEVETTATAITDVETTGIGNEATGEEITEVETTATGSEEGTEITNEENTRTSKDLDLPEQPKDKVEEEIHLATEPSSEAFDALLAEDKPEQAASLFEDEDEDEDEDLPPVTTSEGFFESPGSKKPGTEDFFSSTPAKSSSSPLGDSFFDAPGKASSAGKPSGSDFFSSPSGSLAELTSANDPSDDLEDDFVFVPSRKEEAKEIPFFSSANIAVPPRNDNVASDDVAVPHSNDNVASDDVAVPPSNDNVVPEKPTTENILDITTTQTKADSEESSDNDSYIFSTPVVSDSFFASTSAAKPVASKAPTKSSSSPISDSFFSSTPTKSKASPSADPFFSSVASSKSPDPFFSSKKSTLPEDDFFSPKKTSTASTGLFSSPSFPTIKTTLPLEEDDDVLFAPPITPVTVTTTPTISSPVTTTNTTTTTTTTTPAADEDDDFFSPSASPAPSPFLAKAQQKSEIEEEQAAKKEERQKRPTIREVPEYPWISLYPEFMKPEGIAFIPLTSSEVTSLVSFTYSRHDGRAINHHVSDREKSIMTDFESRIDVEIDRMGGPQENIVVSVNFAVPADSARVRNKTVETYLIASLQKHMAENRGIDPTHNQRLLMLQDACSRGYKVKTGKEAVELIRKSSRVKEEITSALTDHVMYFVVRKWFSIPVHLEFYLFIYNKKLITIAQYHENCHFPELVQEKFNVVTKLNNASNRVANKMTDESCLLHVGISEDGDVQIIDYIPLTINCLFLQNAPQVFGKSMTDHLLAPLINDKVNVFFKEEPLLPGTGIAKYWQDFFKTAESKAKTEAKQNSGAGGDENCCLQ